MLQSGHFLLLTTFNLDKWLLRFDSSNALSATLHEFLIIEHIQSESRKHERLNNSVRYFKFDMINFQRN